MTMLGFVLYGSLLLLPIFLQTHAGLSGARMPASRWPRADWAAS